ncbi:MAG: succinate dehydrogenase [Deltaproteobacteria bacterium]|nr:succinate dehydrogenase [Deltaproteobacteria bacterium]
MSSSFNNTAPGFLVRNEFWLKRLHSLSGILPIGAYVVFHFFQNSYAQHGPERYNEVVHALQGIPYRFILELGVIALPILYHALYGFAILRWGAPNVRAYPYLANWRYVFQRLTGVVALAYIVFHVYRTTMQDYLYGREVNFQLMAIDLSQPWIFLCYAIGIVCVAYHFGNGLWSFLITWGITRGERAQRVSSLICLGIFVSMAVWGIHILTRFI